MCIAIPSRVIKIDGFIATVERFGEVKETNTMLLGEDVKIGDYLILQAGGFATEIVDEEAALEAIRLFKELEGDLEMMGLGQQQGLPKSNRD